MINLYRYRLPFCSPFKTARGTFKERTGLLVQIRNESVSALTEAAPLPGFSRESLDDTELCLTRIHTDFSDFLKNDWSLLDFRQFLNSRSLTPSAEFALSTLAASLKLQTGLANVSDLFSQKFRKEVKVNAVTGLENPEQIISAVDAHYNNGFRTVKIKSSSTTAPLITALKELSLKYPDISFRIDANQSWPLNRTLQIIEGFTGLNVEYIEEPVKVSSAMDYSNLVNESPIPIALDESINSVDMLEQALQELENAVFILKPMLLGDIFRISETISENRGPLQKIVVTTALESAVGRIMVNTIAAIVGDPGLAHGLNTGDLFQKDLYQLQTASGGFIKLNAPFQSFSLSDIDQNLIQKIL